MLRTTSIVVAIASVALALSGGSAGSALGESAPALVWLIAVGLAVLDLRLRNALTATVLGGAGLYAIAFGLEAAIGEAARFAGSDVFAAGLLLLKPANTWAPAWLANVAFLAGILLVGWRANVPSAVAGIVAAALALTAFRWLGHDLQPGVGFWIWAFAPLSLALAVALEVRRQPQRNVTATG
ncbi:MAG: hypothetical protein L0221_05395 [Chloroflexi bacterium]|nr:hypothetical protein [Chloroflexota bacterium]